MVMTSYTVSKSKFDVLLRFSMFYVVCIFNAKPGFGLNDHYVSRIYIFLIQTVANLN